MHAEVSRWGYRKYHLQANEWNLTRNQLRQSHGLQRKSQSGGKWLYVKSHHNLDEKVTSEQVWEGNCHEHGIWFGELYLRSSLMNNVWERSSYLSPWGQKEDIWMLSPEDMGSSSWLQRNSATFVTLIIANLTSSVLSFSLQSSTSAICFVSF